MQNYPIGTRLLIFTSNVTGLKMHEIYRFAVFRYIIRALDNLDGTPPT
jgi:hypothetical protein